MAIELLLIAAQYLESHQIAAVDNACLLCDHGYASLSTPAALPRRRRPSKTRSSSSKKRSLHRTGRSMHNEMEKTRRANLRQCLEQLRDMMPGSASGKTTTLQLLKRAKLHITRLEADYRSHEQMKASLMDQQRQLNNCLHQNHRRRPLQCDEMAGTCRHVTSLMQCLVDAEETDSNSDSGASSMVMSNSSDNDDVDIMGSASDCDDYC